MSKSPHRGGLGRTSAWKRSTHSTEPRPAIHGALDWPAILQDFGIGAEYLTNRHGPCPGCGGKDRFRFDDKEGRGTWYCGGGGEPSSGDGYALLSHVHGWSGSNSEAYKRVNQHVGVGFTASTTLPRKPRTERPQSRPEPSPTQGYAKSLWRAGSGGDELIASHPYALAKAIDWEAGVRRGTVSGRIVGRDADCLVIPIRDLATFAVVAVQAITADGRKQTFGPLKGNAFVCGNDLDKSADWFVVEGWADAISILRAVNNSCVFAACGVNVFEPLRDRIGEVYGPDRLVLMEDAAP